MLHVGTRPFRDCQPQAPVCQLTFASDEGLTRRALRDPEAHGSDILEDPDFVLETMVYDSKHYSLSNRRLLCLKQALPQCRQNGEMQRAHELEHVRVRVRPLHIQSEWTNTPKGATSVLWKFCKSFTTMACATTTTTKIPPQSPKPLPTPRRPPSLPSRGSLVADSLQHSTKELSMNVFGLSSAAQVTLES